MKLLLAGLCAALVYVVNPLFVLGTDDEPDFGETEMRAAIEGTWLLVVPEQGAYTFRIRQAGESTQTGAASFFSSAHACGTRTFVRSAGACSIDTLMPVEIHHAQTTTSVFEVYGPTFQAGSLKLVIDAHAIQAWITRDGTAKEVSHGATLVRLAR